MTPKCWDVLITFFVLDIQFWLIHVYLFSWPNYQEPWKGNNSLEKDFYSSLISSRPFSGNVYFLQRNHDDKKLWLHFLERHNCINVWMPVILPFTYWDVLKIKFCFGEFLLSEMLQVILH